MYKLICLFLMILWNVLNLESKSIDKFDNPGSWKTEYEQGVTMTVRPYSGIQNRCVKIKFHFNSGSWLQIKKDFPIDLSKYKGVSFFIKGKGKVNDLQFKLVDIDGTTYGKTIKGVTKIPEWKKINIKFDDMNYFWGGADKKLDLKYIREIFFSIVKNRGGSGEVYIDNLETGISGIYKSQHKQSRFYKVIGDRKVAHKAYKWIKSMQQKSGLILSYEGDTKPFSWLYDQALCLIVLAKEDRKAAKKLLNILIKLQKSPGYWNDGFIIRTKKNTAVHLGKEDKKKWFSSGVDGVLYEYDNQWVGSVAWTVYSIYRYGEITGDKSYYKYALKGARWLIKQQREDGSFHNVTEGNLDVWWALYFTGYKNAAERLKNYLINKVWNKTEKRFNVASDNTELYLDCQTWGASFTRGAGVPEYGLYSLAFAKKYLECRTFDTLTTGFDATGPYTVWNEGTLQYIVAGGEKAQFYLGQMNKQQRIDGALQHSHEGFSKGGAWHTVMYGVCPTAWLYFANTGEPFIYK